MSYSSSFKPTENNKHFTVVGRSNPGSYTSTHNYPIPRDYQRRTPGKILKVKVWKLSKEHDELIERAIANGIFKQVNDAINGVAK